MSAAVLTREEKVQLYMKIFYWLAILTVIEVVIFEAGHRMGVHEGLAKLILNFFIVVFSASKAVIVGYYYMHLNHETKALKVIAILPLIAFFYAFWLIYDARTRQAHEYFPLRHEHVFQGHHEEEKLETPAGGWAPHLPNGAQVKKSEGGAEGAPAASAPAAAPAAGNPEVDQWK